MIWELTAEGREYADQSPVWQTLVPGPMEGMDIVKATGFSVEQVKAHLDAGVKQGVVRQVSSQAAQPSTEAGSGYNAMADLGKDYLTG